MTMVWSVEFTQEDAVRVQHTAEMAGYGTNGAIDFIRDTVLRTLPREGVVAQTDHEFGVMHTFPSEDLATLVFMIAGGAAGEVMRLAPEVVMPTEAITEVIHIIMKEQGHDISDVPGYRPNKGTSILKSATTEVQG